MIVLLKVFLFSFLLDGAPLGTNLVQEPSLQRWSLAVHPREQRRAVRSNRFRIVAGRVYENGLDSEAGNTIDIAREVCEEDDEEQIFESPFLDSLLGLDAVNDFDEIVRVQRLRFRVRNVDGFGASLRARRLSPIGLREIPPGGAATEVLSFFMEAQGDDRVFAGSSQVLPIDPGFKTVRVRIRARRGRQRLTTSARLTFSFDNFDRCR